MHTSKCMVVLMNIWQILHGQGHDPVHVCKFWNKWYLFFQEATQRTEHISVEVGHAERDAAQEPYENKAVKKTSHAGF